MFEKRLSLVLFCSLAVACGDTAEGWQETPAGGGPRILWDLEAEPLPELPLPNDVATWPDPSSATGLRLNVSTIAPTHMEQDLRGHFAELDGWSTYGPITIPLDGLLDLNALLERQGGTDHFSAGDFQEHAVYLLDLETGVPVPLDVNGGNFVHVLSDPDQFGPNDPHAGESNLLFETHAEDRNGNGQLDPGEDLDFDGVLDQPNTMDGTLDGSPLETVDRMAWFFERQTNTLIVKPLLPLRGERSYAVVVTDRLLGEEGEPVRSPFRYVHHFAQKEALEGLPELFSARPHIYGDLAERGWEGVAFAWKFTTASVTRVLDTVREGLYGRGPMARLQGELPPDMAMMPMQGGNGPDDPCAEGGAKRYVASGDAVRSVMALIFQQAFGLEPGQLGPALATYDSLGHVVAGIFETPYFLGDPDKPDLNEVFELDWQTGKGRVGREAIPMVIFVPKEREGHSQPFPVAFYVHGHGSSYVEPLPWVGTMLSHGFAVAVVNAQGHGASLDPTDQVLVSAIFAGDCLAPTADAMLAGRARDLDGDGDLDSGSNFWTAYSFHTRDVVRQTIIDHLRAIQILRSYDGSRRSSATEFASELVAGPLGRSGDLDEDGVADLAGDFDGDGIPDVGGPEQRFYFSGGSLGGIMTGIIAGVEPAINVSVPIVGAGGLADITVRTLNSAVNSAVHFRLLGPLIVSEPSAGPDENSACQAGEHSLRIVASDLSSTANFEFACVPGDLLGPDDVMIVRNLSNGELRCGGAVHGEAGRFRVAIESSKEDLWAVEIYRNASARIDYGSCNFSGGELAPDRVIDTFEVGQGENGERTCSRCARYQQRSWQVGETLVAPTAGMARRRQSPDLRRLMMLGQLALDDADPINYARRIFLEPISSPDVPQRPRSVMVVNTIGDNNVVINAGNAYARAAGVLPFLPPDAPEELKEWRAPASFASRYGEGMVTPNDVLIRHHILEGVSRLKRHPVEGADHLLFDVDDLAEGRLTFAANGRKQEVGGIVPPHLDDPLRWTRVTRSMEGPDDDVWTPAEAAPLSGVLNVYTVGTGAHGFDPGTLFDPDAPFDIAQYLFNLLGRYLGSDAVDVPYVRDPEGHHCMEDSSCETR